MSVSAKPSLCFHYPAPLRKRTDAVLSRIERDDDATEQAGALSAVVLELTKAGLDYYFLRGVEQARLGFVARQASSLATAGAVRVLSPIIGRILAGADSEQLRAVARHIRHLMADPTAERPAGRSRNVAARAARV